MSERRVVVIGAGVAGLVAAASLAGRGLDVTVLERAAGPGGKMREVEVAGRRVDAGPTVLTMRPVFEAIFADAGVALAEHVTMRPATILARHAWGEGERLDLYADIDASVDAIAAFAGPEEGRRYRRFCAHAGRVFDTLDASFIRAARPSVHTFIGGVGVRGLGGLWAMQPFTTLWQALGEHFHDPRLRQLFGRYATYCGSSPFAAPATLVLVAHVEQTGVWLVEGGMHRLAVALAELAGRRGATLRYEAEVGAIEVAGGRVAGVRLADGERLGADAVIASTDVAALASGRLGPAVEGAVPPTAPAARSLSAFTWALLAEAEGFPLLRHNVFFSSDYRAEFDDIFERKRVPTEPTVYVCAQDRDAGDGPAPPRAERLLCLVNAPAIGDTHSFDAAEVERCQERTFGLMERCGLRLSPTASVVTTPTDFARLFPATGGALYGRASHGWRASFERPTARTRLPGLYLAGGSTHPGPGVPMAALSGRMAAASLAADLGSTSRSRRAATSGGISTR